MKTYVMAAALAGAAVFPVVAQSGGGSSDTLSALLAEVRALRVAMERAASTTPQIQLLAARLTVQNERLSRATQDVNQVHEQLEDLLASTTSAAARVSGIEEMVSRESNPDTVKTLRAEQTALRSQIDDRGAQETRLRAREAELSNVAAAEQAQWNELNGRLDALERELAARRPQ
jgi:DNA repair exonuclease SbcCD ATPase subunit